MGLAMRGRRGILCGGVVEMAWVVDLCGMLGECGATLSMFWHFHNPRFYMESVMALYTRLFALS